MAPRRIFVPHIHEDDEHVDGLRQFLNRSGREADVSAIDSSSPNNANDPDYITSRYISPKIEWCEAIVVLISPATQGSDWVDKEIELAKRLDRFDHDAIFTDVAVREHRRGLVIVHRLLDADVR